MRPGSVWRKSATRFAVLLAALVAMSFAVSACGGDDDDSGSDSASSGSGSTELPGADVSDEDLQAAMEVAFFEELSIDDLDPTMAEALRVASIELTPEQTTKLQECLSQNECDTGTGGELTVGIADPFGGIPWRVQARIEATAQALAYPQVGRIIYTDGNADEQQSLANFRSLMSQNVDVIVGYFDFAASMPAMIKQATSQGIQVVPYIGPVPGIEPGVEMTSQVVPDLCETGTAMAASVVEEGGENEAAALFTGIPGNASDEWQDCAKTEFENSGWEVAFEGTTEWTPQGEIQAGSELIASGDPVDAILYDNTGANFLVPYKRAGETPPMIVSWANSLQYYNAYEADAGGVPNFIINGQTWTPRPAVTAGVKAALGEEVAPVINLNQPIVLTEDAMSIVQPTRDEGLPEGYTPSTFAPVDVVKEALG